MNYKLKLKKCIDRLTFDSSIAIVRSKFVRIYATEGPFSLRTGGGGCGFGLGLGLGYTGYTIGFGDEDEDGDGGFGLGGSTTFGGVTGFGGSGCDGWIGVLSETEGS